MKNIIIGIFKEESKAYETLSELKSRSGSSTVITAGIVKNENGNVLVKDGYNFDDYESNWAAGGIIGGLIGIIGGPIGILLGGSMGTLIGSAVDMSNADESFNIGRQVVSKLQNNQLALIIMAEEPSIDELDEFLFKYDCDQIIRESYVDVQVEIYQAQELEERLAKEANKKIREDKKEEWRHKAEEKQDELDKKVDNVKTKIKSIFD